MKSNGFSLVESFNNRSGFTNVGRSNSYPNVEVANHFIKEKRNLTECYMVGIVLSTFYSKLFQNVQIA